MGCGASDIEGGITIVLTKQTADALIYLAGEHVEGIIEFDSAQYDPNEQLKGAYIELVGQVVYTTTSHNGNGGTHYTVHRVPFFSERQDFHSELTSVRQVYFVNQNQTESVCTYSRKRTF